jgi:hypothetical protein
MTLREYIIKASKRDEYWELVDNTFITALNAQESQLVRKVPMYDISKGSFLWGWKVTDAWVELTENDDEALIVVVCENEEEDEDYIKFIDD